VRFLFYVHYFELQVISEVKFKTTHVFSKFTLESLFYIFYAMPSDILQVRGSLYFFWYWAYI
jgi:CCR4-NOT transcriptional regulation complex NOT5 subunit